MQRGYRISISRDLLKGGAKAAPGGSRQVQRTGLLSVACTLLEQQTLFDPSYAVRDAAGA